MTTLTLILSLLPIVFSCLAVFCLWKADRSFQEARRLQQESLRKLRQWDTEGVPSTRVNE